MRQINLDIRRKNKKETSPAPQDENVTLRAPFNFVPWGVDQRQFKMNRELERELNRGIVKKSARERKKKRDPQ